MVQGVDYRIPASVKGLDLTGAVNGYMAGQQNKRQNALLDLTTQEKEQRMQHLDDESRMKSIAGFAVQIKPFLDAGDSAGAQRVFNQRLSDIKSRGGNPEDTLDLAPSLMSGDLESAKMMIDSFIGSAQQQGYLKGSGSSDLPSSVQEYQFFNRLSENEQKDFLGLKRGPKLITYGDVQGYVDPLTDTFVPISEGGDKTTNEVQSDIDELRSNQNADKLDQEINAASEREFKKQIGVEGAQVYSTLQKAAQDASEFIPRLQSLRDLAYKVETGTGAEVKLAAKKALGIDSADMEELNAKLGELAQDILNQQTGTKTDFDFQNAVRQSASLGKTPEANVRLINALIERQQQAVYFADQARKAYDNDGVKGVLDMRYSAPVEAPSLNGSSGFDDSLLEFMEPEERALFQ